jgi:hypothetical protein
MRHRSNCHAFFNGQHIVGDFENAKLYALDLDTFTDDGNIIRRVRRTTTMNDDQARLFFSRLQVDVESGVGLEIGQGSDPQLMLRYSDDGGNTWSNTKYATMGKIGEYKSRCVFTRLGSGRNRVWEISVTDPVKAVILGANAEIMKGT